MKIGFIGLGKLGLPCAEVIADRTKHIVEGYDLLPKSTPSFKINDTLDETVKDKDIVFVATPTPHEQGYDGRNPSSQLEPKDFDYSSVIDVLTKCNAVMNDNQILVLISTVLPGTIRKHLAPIITNTRFVYNPYLIAMGTVKSDFLDPDMIMIGTMDGGRTPEAMQVANLYYEISGFKPRTEFVNWDECEAIKIFYNTWISTKIAFVNLIQDIAVKNTNINVDKVTEALANSNRSILGKKYMRAGMGDGGACHPRDNIALRWLARELNIGYDFFGNIMDTRERQAENMAKEILKHGNNIWFSSDSYKPNTDLLDGSYSLLVQHFVKQHGGQIVQGIDNKVEVIVRVHETDVFTTDETTIVFDPWRTYPPGKNVVYYGRPR